MKFLVGHTGFVGSNLVETNRFEGMFNSKNIDESFGKCPDLLYYCGVKSQMFVANNSPDKDLAHINDAIMNIEKIQPQKVVLISTVAVYDNPVNVTEDTIPDADKLSPYGRNRLMLEQWVESNFKNYLIVRLPALYGKNLKKNFIYDYLNLIPKFLTPAKYIELENLHACLSEFYQINTNGYYECKSLTLAERSFLTSFFQDINFTSLLFTDSRSQYQFYNLHRLWRDLEIALSANVKKINLVTEPIKISVLYRYLEQEQFINHLAAPLFVYNCKTKFADLYSQSKDYIVTQRDSLTDIREFIVEYKKKDSFYALN